MEVREVTGQRDKRLFYYLMSLVHKQGIRPGLGRARYFVGYVREMGSEYWLAGAMLQSPMVFASALSRLNIDLTHSYFIRRIARFVPKNPCGDVLVEFVDKLAKRLAGEGKELLITMGLDDHTNKLYVEAGFREVGKTNTGKPVFILELDKYR